MVSAQLPSPPKVFLSYSHDSPEHMDRVLALCDRLREDGVDAWIDQYETAPPEGWSQWCTRQVEEADFVLVVCTENYEQRFRGAESPGTGLGVQWEGYAIVRELQDAGTLKTKYISVLWPPSGEEQIPLALRGTTCYHLGETEAYENLYGQLIGQQKTPAPQLGRLLPMPPQERRPARFSVNSEPRGVGDDESLQPGDLLAEERFHLLEVIGRGGFATVWKAWDEERQILVAVKVLHDQHAEDRTRRERFFRGARKMAELHHQGIARVIEAELEENEKHFFVMDYVGNGDLRRAVLSGELPREQVIPLILTVGEALTFAHEKGVIHRDVKPANILLDGDRPKLTDFDLVHALDTTGGTQTHGLLGTFLYSAPELLGDAKRASVAADVYSLAMTTIFALYGKDLPPDVWRQPETFLGKLPCHPALRVALSRGISWEPEGRPGSVTELCEALRLGNHASVPSKELLHEVDGTVLLYVPGGVYTLGAEDVNEAAKPSHRVILSPFWIAKYPVTNEQYARFLASNSWAHTPRHWTNKRFNQPQQPVVGVSWEEAQAYCRWAGLYLPSEAQWEAAARGTDGRRYPWGSEAPIPELANFGDREDRPTKVGYYWQGAGPFGALDQAGNVWEWCADVWDAAAYRGRDGQLDPLNTIGDPTLRCLRGGSWDGDAVCLAVAYRYRAVSIDRYSYVGFRGLLPAGPES